MGTTHCVKIVVATTTNSCVEEEEEEEKTIYVSKNGVNIEEVTNTHYSCPPPKKQLK